MDDAEVMLTDGMKGVEVREKRREKERQRSAEPRQRRMNK